MAGWMVLIPMDDDAEWVELEGGLKVRRRFEAQFRWSGRFERALLRVEVEEGRARVVELHVTEADGHGVSKVVLDGVPLQKLLESALVHVTAFAGVPTGEEDGSTRGARGDVELARVTRAVQRTARRRLNELRLAEVAEAYARAGIEGIEELGVSERHAYRLKRRAVEAGLITEGEERS